MRSLAKNTRIETKIKQRQPPSYPPPPPKNKSLPHRHRDSGRFEIRCVLEDLRRITRKLSVHLFYVDTLRAFSPWLPQVSARSRTLGCFFCYRRTSHHSLGTEVSTRNWSSCQNAQYNIYLSTICVKNTVFKVLISFICTRGSLK